MPIYSMCAAAATAHTWRTPTCTLRAEGRVVLWQSARNGAACISHGPHGYHLGSTWVLPGYHLGSTLERVDKAHIVCGVCGTMP